MAPGPHGPYGAHKGSFGLMGPHWPSSGLCGRFKPYGPNVNPLLLPLINSTRKVMVHIGGDGQQMQHVGLANSYQNVKQRFQILPKTIQKTLRHVGPYKAQSAPMGL